MQIQENPKMDSNIVCQLFSITEPLFWFLFGDKSLGQIFENQL